ncbi:hypothetical protein WJX77_002736 [Trebouxia sp. C0004]
MSPPAAAASAFERTLLTPTSWVLQVKGIPESSTNEEMRKHFSEAIAYFRGSPFTYAFLHTDPTRHALDPARPPHHALLHYSSLDAARYAEDCLWRAAQAFPDPWAWFLADAETHVLERRVWATQPDTQAPLPKDVPITEAATTLSKSITPALAVSHAPLQSSSVHIPKQSGNFASLDIPEPAADPTPAASLDHPPLPLLDSPVAALLDPPPCPPVHPPPGHPSRPPPAMSLTDPARPASDPPPGPPSNSSSAVSLAPPDPPSEPPPESHADRPPLPTFPRPPPPASPSAATANSVLPPLPWSAAVAAPAAVDKIQPPQPATLHCPLPLPCLPMPLTAPPAPPVALLQLGLAHQLDLAHQANSKCAAVPHQAQGQVAGQQTDSSREASGILMPTADQVCLTLRSDGNLRHCSSKQHAAEQSMHPSTVLQASGVQSQTAAAPWGKVSLCDFRQLDSSDSAGAKRPSSAASGLHEQVHLAHDKAKHQPAAQRDKVPIDASHDSSRHASRDNSGERKHSSSREQAHEKPSHWRDASSDRHDKSHRNDGSRYRHDRTQDRHGRLSDPHGTKTPRVCMASISAPKAEARHKKGIQATEKNRSSMHLVRIDLA